MTDTADLVARLHREVNTWSMPGSGQELPPIAKLLQEAADMIERLQENYQVTMKTLAGTVKFGQETIDKLRLEIERLTKERDDS